MYVSKISRGEVEPTKLGLPPAAPQVTNNRSCSAGSRLRPAKLLAEASAEAVIETHIGDAYACILGAHMRAELGRLCVHHSAQFRETFIENTLPEWAHMRHVWWRICVISGGAYSSHPVAHMHTQHGALMGALNSYSRSNKWALAARQAPSRFLWVRSRRMKFLRRTNM